MRGRNSVEEGIPIAVIDATSNLSTEIFLQQVRCQVTAYVVKDNDNLQEGVAQTTTFEEFLQQQVTDLFLTTGCRIDWKGGIRIHCRQKLDLSYGRLILTALLRC